MRVTAIVLAAGKGLRFNSKIPKPLVKIGSRPLIVHCLGILSRHPYINDIIVTVNSQTKDEIIGKISQYRIPKIRGVVLGGRTRQDSVFRGLKAMDIKTDLVLIHDAARPFIHKDTVSSVIKEAQKYGAAVVGVPVKATIKQAAGHRFPSAGSNIVRKTLNRDNLWEIQTPQVFRKDLIFKAYRKYRGIAVTDDAALVERLKAKVKLVRGSYFNIKITTPEDLVLAKAISRSLSANGKIKIAE